METASAFSNLTTSASSDHRALWNNRGVACASHQSHLRTLVASNNASSSPFSPCAPRKDQNERSLRFRRRLVCFLSNYRAFAEMRPMHIIIPSCALVMHRLYPGVSLLSTRRAETAYVRRNFVHRHFLWANRKIRVRFAQSRAFIVELSQTL